MSDKNENENAAAEGNDAGEDKPLMEEEAVKSNKSNKQPSNNGGEAAVIGKDETLDNLSTASEDAHHRNVKDGEMCCCCICNCSKPETVNLSCFGCFPIKCGIVCIGIFTLFLILSSFIEIFYMLLNEYIHWWYVLVALLLLVPTIIAASMLTAFFNNDTHERRSSLRCACILVIISFSLLAIWNIFYFQFWYKNADVMFGQPELGYVKQTKKQFVFWSVFFSLTIDGFYAYFICVVSHYKNALSPPKAEKDSDVKSNKSDKTTKSTKSVIKSNKGANDNVNNV